MNITDESFEKEISSTDKFVLVDFFATWCEPCTVLGPVIEKVAEDFKDKLILIKANVDEFPATSQKFNIDRIPNVILFKDGKPVNGFVGLVQKRILGSGWAILLTNK